MFAIKLFANLKTKLLFSFLNSVAYKQKKFFWEHFMIIFFRRVRIIGNHYWHQSPPPRTSARSPPVGQTLGSDDLPEGRSLVTERPLQKKNIDTSVRSTVRRRTVTGRPWWWVGTDAMMWNMCPKLKKKAVDFVEQGQERTTPKRTDVSQIFDIFAPKNCDQKVTKFSSEKNLLQ